jgi:hypothetical protein
VGYGVVQIAEEGGLETGPLAVASEAEAVERRLTLVRSPGALPRHPRAPLYWTVIGVCGVGLAAGLIALILVSESWVPRPAPASEEPWLHPLGHPVNMLARAPVLPAQPVQPHPPQPFIEVQIPDVPPDPAPAPAPIQAPAVAQDQARLADDRPAERETFGTSVGFVRNPQEATRLAAAEHKLTFLLHVSGNFEDNCFT